MNIFFDLPNLLICLLAVFIVFRLGIIPAWIALILSLQAFTPYFLNNFLFPANYMPDQFRYFDAVSQLRLLNFNHDDNYKIIITSWFLNFLPLPFLETITSLGFYNRFMFIVLFVWLYKKKFLSGITLYIVLFYPSLLLYTSLSLRDPLILILMIISTIFFLEKKYPQSFLMVIPLFLIKFQNFYLMLILFFILYLFRKDSFFYKIRYLLIVGFIVIIISYIDPILEQLNYYRFLLYIDNDGDRQLFSNIQDIYEFLIYGFKSALYFIVKPLPWEVNNFLQVIQSVENIVLILVIYIFTKRAYIQDRAITIKWLLFILFALTIYGLTIFNFGTAARYKMPFITLYVIGLSYELYKIKGYRFGK